MQRAQDLAVAADAPDWNAAADRVDDLIEYLPRTRSPGVRAGRAGRQLPARAAC